MKSFDYDGMAEEVYSTIVTETIQRPYLRMGPPKTKGTWGRITITDADDLLADVVEASVSRDMYTALGRAIQRKVEGSTHFGEPAIQFALFGAVGTPPKALTNPRGTWIIPLKQAADTLDAGVAQVVISTNETLVSLLTRFMSLTERLQSDNLEARVDLAAAEAHEEAHDTTAKWAAAAIFAKEWAEPAAEAAKAAGETAHAAMLRAQAQAASTPAGTATMADVLAYVGALPEDTRAALRTAAEGMTLEQISAMLFGTEE